jgi:hypothetical protein
MTIVELIGVSLRFTAVVGVRCFDYAQHKCFDYAQHKCFDYAQHMNCAPAKG